MSHLEIEITERELRRILAELAGTASMCWIPKPSNAVFESTEAGVAIDRAYKEITEGPPPKPNVPYPEFCRHPDKCAGRSTCPRDPCCCD